MVDKTEPIEGYDDMTVAEIVDEMEGMDAEEVQAVKDYEAEGKARKGVLSFGADSEAEAEPAESKTPKALPVTVNNYTRRHGDEQVLGGWVDVVGGDHAGKYGAYIQDVTNDPTDGYPETVLVRTRDADNELIEVNYADTRPSVRTGGR